MIMFLLRSSESIQSPRLLRHPSAPIGYHYAIGCIRGLRLRNNHTARLSIETGVPPAILPLPCSPRIGAVNIRVPRAFRSQDHAGLGDNPTTGSQQGCPLGKTSTLLLRIMRWQNTIVLLEHVVQLRQYILAHVGERIRETLEQGLFSPAY